MKLLEDYILKCNKLWSCSKNWCSIVTNYEVVPRLGDLYTYCIVTNNEVVPWIGVLYTYWIVTNYEVVPRLGVLYTYWIVTNL
jgi:hypothetical protein